MKYVAVAGAGASGMMAAIAAAMNGARVYLFEKNEFPGRKLMQTGNGKCNLSNSEVSVGRYRGSLIECGLAEEIFNEFGKDDTLELFSSLGLLMKEKNGGLYPRSDSARTVCDILLKRLHELKVEIFCRKAVKRIEKNSSGFSLILDDLSTGKKVREDRVFDSVIISTGGKAAPKTGSTGDAYYFAREFAISLTEPLPGLVRLYSCDLFFKGINGVRTDAEIKLLIDGVLCGSSKGEMQLTDKGPSGICAFDLSGRIGRGLSQNKKCAVAVDFLPEYDEEKVSSLILGRKISEDDLFLGIFSDRLSTAMFRYIRSVNPGLKGINGVVDKDTADRIAGLIKNVVFDINGIGDFSSSQITTGGIEGSALNKDLSVKGIPGLYFTGEALDIDGDCGGFNLQWAWSSGFVAGKSAAGEVI